MIRSLNYLIIMLFLGSCASGGLTEEFTQSIYAPSEANGFEILGAPDRESVLIRSKSPWQGASNETNRDLLIIRGGEAVPDNYEGCILSDHAERIICMSSGHIAMISLLGESESIVGASGINYVTSPEIQSRRGEIAEVGHEGSINYEAIVAARPDLVVLYGVNSVNPMEAKLKELKIPYIYIGDYLEESPLGKAEWLVALGECLGQRKEAIEHYRPIKENYNNIKAKVDSLGIVNRPKVMLNAPYGDQWMMPSEDNYMVRLIKDAGGEYLLSSLHGNSSKSISMEEALAMMGRADKWLNIGNAFTSIEKVKKELPLFSNSKVVREGQIFNNTLRSTAAGGNDFFESGIVNPDLILRDLIKIMHPELVEEPFFYYTKLPATEISELTQPESLETVETED